MKKNFDVYLFIIVFFFIGMLSLSFVFTKKENFSDVENRYLQAFNINKINDYLSDHFPFRSFFIKLKNKVEVLSGKTLINGVYVAKDGYLLPSFQDNDKKNYLIEAINDFAFHKNVDVMIVPDSILINQDKLKRTVSLSEEAEILNFYAQLKYSNNINLIETFNEKNKDVQLYYKTDHHWTTNGAYIAYQEYCQNNNISYLNEKEFNVQKVTDNFWGTSSSLVLGYGTNEDIYVYEKDNNLEVSYVYENKKTNTLYNYEYLNKKDKYALFLDNNHALIQIKNNDINDGSSILIIKNSYANSFVPFIVNHYETVHVIDLRYFAQNVSDYVNDHQIEKTLILYNLNNLYSDMSLVKLR